MLQKLAEFFRQLMGAVKIKLPFYGDKHMQPGFSRSLDERRAGKFIQGLFYQRRHTAGLTESRPVQFRFFADSFFAGIDVRINIKNQEIRVIRVKIRIFFAFGGDF